MRFFIEFPEHTRRQELNRDVAAMSVDELQICFPGDVTIAHDDVCLMPFVDAPVLGLALGFVEAVWELRIGHQAASFRDFYGEFDVEIRTSPEGNVDVIDSFRGVHFSVSFEEMVSACRDFARNVTDAMRNTFPEITKNANLARLEERLYVLDR